MRNESISLGKERLAFVDMLCKENNISRSQLFQCIVDTLRKMNLYMTIMQIALLQRRILNESV